MVNPASFRVFLSAASAELATYREEVARVLRRKGIEVREQQHFRQSGGTLLDTLNDYIEQCDAVICLIGDRCGSLPTNEHMAVMGDNDWLNRYRAESGQSSVSYTQWEFLLAKSQTKLTYVFLTDDGFTPDGNAIEDVEESGMQQKLQASYREWIRQSGEHWAPLNTSAKLIEDVLVLQLPDLTRGKPNNLPHTSLGTLFKGRQQVLEELHRTLDRSAPGATAITDMAHPLRAQAIHGSGGIGKTRVAIEYAWRYAFDYNALLFLSAQDPETLNNSLAALSEVLSVDGLAAAPDDRRIKATLNWLQTHPGWLMILDNVDSPEAAKAIKARLPQLTQGQVLITSRLSQWSVGVETLGLGVLAIDDASSYLLDATQAIRIPTNQDQDLARQIAEKVGQMALGLEHAVAWINARYLGFQDYLNQWEQDEAEILKSFDLELIEYPHELLVTWKLSVDQLDDEARTLLEIVSWFSPEPIPDTFFQVLPVEGQSTVRRAFATLTKYSLANRVQLVDQPGFQVHRLVQATTRWHQQKSEDNDLPALEQALAWANEGYQKDPSDVRNWPNLEPLTEHVEAICQFAEAAGKIDQARPTTRLLTNLAVFYHNKARFTAAEPLMWRALAIDELNFGEDHPRVATDLNNLAQLLQATNRLSEVEPLLRRALTIDEKSYGDDHPEVAIGLNNLASLLRTMNRLSEAEELVRRALTIDKQSYGKTHSNVARDLNNLAQLLKDTNRLSEAEPLMHQARAIDEHTYGKDHPIVAIHLSNLAALLRDTDRLSEAEKLMRRALKIDVQCYGVDHPTVALRLNTLAQLLKNTNRQPEAELLLSRTLGIDE